MAFRPNFAASLAIKWGDKIKYSIYTGIIAKKCKDSTYNTDDKWHQYRNKDNKKNKRRNYDYFILHEDS